MQGIIDLYTGPSLTYAIIDVRATCKDLVGSQTTFYRRLVSGPTSTEIIEGHIKLSQTVSFNKTIQLLNKVQF